MIANKEKIKNRKEHLINKLNSYKELEKHSLSLIKKKKGNLLSCIDTNGYFYEFKASYSYLLEKDIENFKKYMYIYAKLNILGTDTRGFLRGDRVKFWGILMSNNREILNFVVRNIDIIAYEKEKNKYQKSKTYRFLSRTILLAIKGDWKTVIERSGIYLENPSKESYYKYTYLEFEFLKALAEKNIYKMKETLNAMLDKKVVKKMLNDMDVAFDFYLHMFVIMYAKIAMHHGFDLEIDNEIAPKELIDITPAKEYPEPYEFIKEFDLKTITPKEWKSWIYRYHPNPEELKKEEKEGIFI